jgi:hypothetical protein
MGDIIMSALCCALSLVIYAYLFSFLYDVSV